MGKQASSKCQELPLLALTFMDEIIDKTGIPRPKWAVDLVDTFLAKVKSRPMWEMIDFIVSVYLKKHPEYLNQSRSSYINKFASTKD